MDQRSNNNNNILHKWILPLSTWVSREFLTSHERRGSGCERQTKTNTFQHSNRNLWTHFSLQLFILNENKHQQWHQSNREMNSSDGFPFIPCWISKSRLERALKPTQVDTIAMIIDQKSLSREKISSLKSTKCKSLMDHFSWAFHSSPSLNFRCLLLRINREQAAVTELLGQVTSAACQT